MEALQRNLCTYCSNIDFKNLPAEEEPAVPHQPSLEALKASAESCQLCHLLCKVVNIIRSDIRGEQNGRLPKTAGVFSYVQGVMVYSGRNAMGTFHTSIEPSENQKTSLNRRTTLAPDAQVRPWLFGNWWACSAAWIGGRYDPVDESHWRLIGLGVRLGRTQAEAEGNSRENIPIHRGTYLRIRTDDKSKITSIAPGRLCMADYSSNIALERIRQWIMADDLHNKQPPRLFALPSRVIDVDPEASPTDVRLFEAKGKQARYIALSHRWGGTKTLTTTSTTLERRLSGIRWDELPKTFQDAVQIARLLHVRYLWIDSLCIIQDDTEDWNRESSKIADVYGQAYLTIAAAFSTGSSSGCLLGYSEICKYNAPSPDERSLGIRSSNGRRPRLAQDIQTLQRRSREVASLFVQMDTIFKRDVSRIYITLEWMPSSFKTKPSTYSIPEFGCPVDPLDRSELNQRGWVLQERLLSPRTLHFDKDQMYLESETSIIAEDGSEIKTQLFSLSLLLLRELQSWSDHGIPKHEGCSLIEGHAIAGHRPHGRWDGGWIQHIEDYSRRQLSVPDDKLVALSGVAKYIAMNTNGTYYAGLWESHLHEDLAWRTYPQDEVRVFAPDGFEHQLSDVYYPTQIPARYRAPSWSWASIDARIKFVPLDYGNIVAEILHCHVDESTPFGTVTGGWIKIWAPLFKISQCPPDAKIDKKDPIGFGTLVQFQLDAGITLEGNHYDGISYGEGFFDVAPSFPCYALFLDSSNALLLQSSQQKYKRVGFGRFLRTNKQRVLKPLLYQQEPGIDDDGQGALPRRENIPYGPIGRSQPCCESVYNTTVPRVAHTSWESPRIIVAPSYHSTIHHLLPGRDEQDLVISRGKFKFARWEPFILGGRRELPPDIQIREQIYARMFSPVNYKAHGDKVPWG
ncbi:HET-domain-containing protein [Aspergillus campestris IBT 28561]|uniref:HET-domain-containing protein n=1 Tax=Aspergillus campestris (strain IBT 28561) TaxID=1392248 RepID=A0A2I1D3B2_ASPC2|nr:HET-domain-containing protein [Aspergillus campestris IBT 28561]PKY04370.1 HET-domain-containing protein [Aspergillus campestris IBT 28561]